VQDNLAIGVGPEVGRTLQLLAQYSVVVNFAVNSQKECLFVIDQGLSATVCWQVRVGQATGRACESDQCQQCSIAHA
jgi:hypothetical protein